MARFKIYGASDDLIEVEGLDPIGKKLGDEFSGGDEARMVVMLPTGDVFSVRYGDGARAIWRVEHVSVSGKLEVALTPAPPGNDPDPYTDEMLVNGPVERVEAWDTWPPKVAEVREVLQHRFDDRRGFTDAEVMAMWAGLNGAR